MLQPGTKKNNLTALLTTTVQRKTNAGQFCQGIAFTKNSSGKRKCSMYLNSQADNFFYEFIGPGLSAGRLVCITFRCLYKNNLLFLYACLSDIKIILNFPRLTLVITLEIT